MRIEYRKLTEHDLNTFIRMQITASDLGVLLYSDFGFEKNGNFMQYKL